ncbi:MAG: insulinase family protein [Rhodobiaceae bacterium]|jgi:zinc protease|nr:insulinase family protein [Rhodobiaceae bacterium]MBT5517533.1 insulinase family protein [Rhodobiaceae bacterium]MBT7280658.1 insulinase family protein [Rhodobiaceae bacterium]MDG2495885.1 pitrilysin family protein [Alphaproteobacteria bacterium]
MNKWARLFAGLCISALMAACTPAPDGPKVETARLDNGLEIIVIPDARADVVTHMLWYRVGSADEPIGKSGIAHFFEHLMFRGTEKIAPGDFSKTVARLGGQDNAFTSYDYTAYFQRIARDKLPVMMQMEAERMRALIINPDIVAVERDVILEERSMRVDGRPSRLLSEQMRKRLHAGTAYSVPVIGWRDEIAALNAKDAKSFYDRYYAPDNAVLVIAGAVTLADVLPLAKTYYGPLNPSQRPRDQRRVATDLTVADYAAPQVLKDARVRQDSWRRLYRLPQSTPENRALFAAADVLAGVLDGGLTGRLYQALVVEQKLASGVGAYVDSARLDNGEVMIYASLAPKAGFDDIAAGVDAQIERLKQNPPSEAEIARAKMQLVSSAIFARDSQQTMADIFGRAAMLGLPPQEVIDWTRAIEAVTPEDVRRAAQELLRVEHSLSGHLSGARAKESR